MAPVIHYRLTHSAKSGGHGGNRRVMQVLDLFSRNHLECEIAHDKIGGGTVLSQICAMAKGLPPGKSAPSARFLSLRGLRNYGLMRDIGKTINVEKNSIVMADAFIAAYEVLFDVIRRQGGKIALFPHNIDSLSPGMRHPFSGAMSPRWSREEINSLGKADLVCCISREEQWLLSLYGIDACYLPYEPTPTNRSQLLEIRGRREGQIKDTVLIMGTAGNIPTLKGMQALLRRGKDLVSAAKGMSIVIVGYGTEALAPLAAAFQPSINVLGGVSEEVMNHYFTKASVALVYQEGTTGVLTRIQEFRYSGIPVIANHIAARSYQNTPGVNVAESIDEMLAMLESGPPEDFAPPVPPLKLEQQLIEKMQRLQTGASFTRNLK